MCMHACMYVLVYMYVCVWMHACLYGLVYMCVWMLACFYALVYIMCMGACMLVCACIHVCMDACMFVCACVCHYVCIGMHACTCVCVVQGSLMQKQRKPEGLTQKGKSHNKTLLKLVKGKENCVPSHWRSGVGGENVKCSHCHWLIRVL